MDISKKHYINQIFDNVYVLNLNRREDRLEKITKKLNIIDLKFQRFEAVDGDYININILKPEWISSNKPKNKKYELACLLSHKKIIEHAKENKYKKILILEDDILIDFDSINKVKKISELSNWKLVYLGSTQHKWDVENYNDDFFYSKNSLGTFAYGLDCSIFDYVIDLLESTNTTVDNTMCLVQEKFYGNCFTFFPNLIIADVTESDIRESRNQIEHSKKMQWDLKNYS